MLPSDIALIEDADFKKWVEVRTCHTHIPKKSYHMTYPRTRTHGVFKMRCVSGCMCVYQVYAKDEKKFFADFTKAYVKLTENGCRNLATGGWF
jgi:hypothetical protein